MSSLLHVQDRSVPGLCVYAVTGALGGMWYLNLPKGVRGEELRSVAIYTAGAASVERVSGTPGPFYSGPRAITAGDFSPERHLPFMPAGRLKYTVTAAPFEYFCLLDPQRRDLHPRLYRGSRVSGLGLDPGTQLFLARGTLTVGSTTYTAPARLKVNSEGKFAELSSEALVVELDWLP